MTKQLRDKILGVAGWTPLGGLLAVGVYHAIQSLWTVWLGFMFVVLPLGGLVAVAI